MKCHQCQVLVQDYFDKELDQFTAEAVSAHLEDCSSCTAELEQLTFEKRTYQRYDRELNVSPGLWIKVQAQLAAENSHQNLKWFRRSQIQFSKLLSWRFSAAASAALVLFAIGITVAVMKYLNKQDVSKQVSQTLLEKRQPSEPTNKAPKEPEGRSDEREIKKSMTAWPRRELARGQSFPAKAYAREANTPARLVREAEKKYLSAIAMLTRDARERLSQSDSETRTKLDGALAAIDRTILSTRKVVQRDPNDPVAVQYMLAAYRKKVDVLKEMSSY